MIFIDNFTKKNCFSTMFFIVRDKNEQLVMQISENKIKFSIGKIKFVSKVIDGKFPDYKKVVPTNNEKSI